MTWTIFTGAVQLHRLAFFSPNTMCIALNRLLLTFNFISWPSSLITKGMLLNHNHVASCHITHKQVSSASLVTSCLQLILRLERQFGTTVASQPYCFSLRIWTRQWWL